MGNHLLAQLPLILGRFRDGVKRHAAGRPDARQSVTRRRPRQVGDDGALLGVGKHRVKGMAAAHRNEMDSISKFGIDQQRTEFALYVADDGHPRLEQADVLDERQIGGAGEKRDLRYACRTMRGRFDVLGPGSLSMAGTHGEEPFLEKLRQ